jgi:hypothetical protein
MTAKAFRVNRPDVIDEHFEDEYVIVNLKTGTYYSLNSTGAAIWDEVNREAPHAAILTQLQILYDVDALTLAPHIDRLLTELEAERLIVAVAQPNGAGQSNGAAQPYREAQADVPEPATERHVFAPPTLEKYTDMQALLLLDPIHQVDESGWPAAKPLDVAQGTSLNSAHGESDAG